MRSPANARQPPRTDGRTDGRTDISQYEQTHNMMQVWMGKLSEFQLPAKNPDGRKDMP